MKILLAKILRFVLKPVFLCTYKMVLPKFSEDFPGKRVFIISELPGGEEKWIGTRRRKANLGNTHPWNRYFNKPLHTHPKTLADIETFLLSCKYVSDKKHGVNLIFGNPPIFLNKERPVIVKITQYGLGGI